jgi:hypothetical protein
MWQITVATILNAIRQYCIISTTLIIVQWTITKQAIQRINTMTREKLTINILKKSIRILHKYSNLFVWKSISPFRAIL